MGRSQKHGAVSETGTRLLNWVITIRVLLPMTMLVMLVTVATEESAKLTKTEEGRFYRKDGRSAKGKTAQVRSLRVQIPSLLRFSSHNLY